MLSWLIRTVIASALVLSALLALTTLSRGEQPSARQATPWRGPNGVRVTMDEVRRGAPAVESPRVRNEIEAADHPADAGTDRIGRNIVLKEPPYRFEGILPRVQPVTLAFTAYIGNGVPDTMGAVGPRQFLLVTNNRIKSFNKETGQADAVMDFGLGTFFSPVAPTQFAFDPNVRYDRRAHKWLVGAITAFGSSNGSNRLVFAVSDSGVLSSTTRWTFFQFQFDQPEPAGNTGCSADFPGWGHDAIALYVIASAARCPAGTTAGKAIFVIAKDSLYGAGPLVVSTFRSVDSAIGNPVDDPDSGGGTGYFVGERNLCRLVDAGGAPRLLPCVALQGTELFSFASTIRHRENNEESGSATDNNVSGRLFQSIRAARTAMTRRGHIWTVLSLTLDNTGQVNYANDSTRGSRLGFVWMDIVDIDSDRPRVAQSGRVFQPSQDNDVHQRNYWMPSMAVSGQGHMIIGGSAAGSNEYVNAAAVGRLAGDPPGVFRDPVLYTNAFAAYNANDNQLSNGIRRWGDYSHTSVDPCDDMTMWTVQQYTAEADKWGVAVARMSAPPPVTPTTATPSIVDAGQDAVEVQLRGTATNGAGFFDPGPGFECRLRVEIPGTTVTAVRVIDSTTLSVTLTTRGVSSGPLSMTVTNPDGQSAVGTGLVRVQ